MMFTPSVFGDTFDSFFNDPFDSMTRLARQTGEKAQGLMLRTDIKELENGYELTMDMPGYKKEEIGAELKNGYLTVTASRNENNDEQDDNGRYIRRERYYGTCSRSFYVGKSLHQEDIKAKFENGTLELTFPKNAPQVEENHTISIEG